jgi:hypothetical protein
MVEIQRADEQGRRTDLAAATCAQEASELFLGGPFPPLGLLLESAERHQVALLFEDPFNGVITEAADQLVLEVRDAHVETEILHAVAGEIDAEARQFETAPEVAFFSGVAQTREPSVAPTGAEDVEGAPDVRRAADRHDGHALRTQVPTATGSERFQRASVTQSFDEHDRASVFVVRELHTRNGTVGGQEIDLDQVHGRIDSHGPRTVDSIDVRRRGATASDAGTRGESGSCRSCEYA